MSIFGATDTPVSDFWWRLLRVSNLAISLTKVPGLLVQTLVVVNSLTSTPSSVVDPGIPGEEAQTQKVGVESYYSANFFPKIVWKWKKLERGGHTFLWPLGSANAVVNNNISTTSSFSETTDHLKDLDHLNVHARNQNAISG